MPRQGESKIGKGVSEELAAPCGIYCGACFAFHKGRCAGCLRENREAPSAGIKQCRFYRCAVLEQELADCAGCEKFPCKVLIRFRDTQPGKEVRHYRHVTIDNLERRRETGINSWLLEMEDKWTRGEYHVGPGSKEYWNKRCACPE